MSARRDTHPAWRDLMAARLDRPLTRTELRGLTAHLRSCVNCAQVEHDYREQSQLLHALPPRIPPRDLWARTSAALDREVARGAYRGRWPGRGFGLGAGAGRRPATPSAALMTSLAALGVVAALSVLQLMPGSRLAAPTGAERATPFAVDAQPLAFIGNDAADLYVYQTSVGHVCPPSTPDCAIAEGIMRTQVNLPASMRTRNAALSPTGERLALVGRYVDKDLFAVLILAADGPTGPGNATPAPGSSALNATDSPSTLAPPPSPEDSGQAAQTANPDQTTPAEGAAPTPPVPSPTPPASAIPGLRVLAILEDVESAGAAPAWSPSGEVLAFSAMPADGSHGPDVYVWAPGDERALPITSDHGSYFASWSGDQIVVSRITTLAELAAVLTVVVDPSTHEERIVARSALWLPVVNPARSQAVAWRGELDPGSVPAQPHTGMLYMIDWSRLDPFAAALDASPSAAPTDGQPADTDVALDLGRDPLTAPVVDWQVRWSTDGQVLGVWIADTAGSTWGRLTVLAIDPATHQVSTLEPLLAPTLARRGFTLGLSRVAWVAPSADNPDGGLRVLTWGDDGVGGLRLQQTDLGEVVPAF